METHKKISQFIIYCNKDKCLLFLVIYNIYYAFFYYPIFFQKAENSRLKKASWPKFCNAIFLFLLKIGSGGPVDQQISLGSPKQIMILSHSYSDFHAKCNFDIFGGRAGFEEISVILYCCEIIR